MTNKIKNIGDMMAYACTCGSVKFNLLKSKKIECAGCGSQFGNWENNNLADLLLDQQLAIVADGLQIPVERLKQAVEALEQHEKLHKVKPNEQPAQEPVAWKHDIYTGGGKIMETWYDEIEHHASDMKATPLYTHPAPSWQGLSDDEKVDILAKVLGIKRSEVNLMDLDCAHAIEQALKEKNT